MGDTRHFCTYFDRNYLPAGLALFDSLATNLDDFTLWVLCFDDLTREALEMFPDDRIQAISERDFVRGDEALQAAMVDRSRIEFYFTSTPSLLRYVLQESPDIQRLTYLDADLYFYSSPVPVLEDIRDASIAIHPHRFAEGESHRIERDGRFNVGFVSIANDDTGRECIETWREQCLEWCYDRSEDGKFADQKYLDDWPDRYEDVAVIDQKGIGAARWNVNNDSWLFDGDTVKVDGDPLVFYHFEGFERLYDGVWNPNTSLPRTVQEQVYRPYARKRLGARRYLSEHHQGFAASESTRHTILETGHSLPQNVARATYRIGDLLFDVLSGRLLIAREPAPLMTG